jgi:nucleotide-binding universal stress UspA family protein
MNASLTTILLATDGSSDAALAGRAAADISRKTGAQLHVVHVWTDVPPPAYPALVFDDYSRQAKEEARKLLRRQVWNAQVSGGSVAGHHLREGGPVEEIMFLAEKLEADLVVVGRRGVGRIKRLITGSVSEGVVHRATCPVLVVRGGEQAWPPARIVVGEDGSLPAKRAGGLAMELADALGTEVIFVRAYRHPAEPMGGRSARQRLELDEARLQNLLALAARSERLEAPRRCRPETKLAEGEPALAVLSVARRKRSQPTLLAVGSRGLGAPKRMILGSVSTRVLREAEGPVLIAPRGSRSITATRRPTSAESRRGGSETETAKRVSPHRSR